MIGKSTICGMLKKMPPLVDKSKILKVYVDDFALKKRYTYGSVMSNWDTHPIIDIIPSRVEIPAQEEMTDEMKALYNTANGARRIRYAHQKYRDGYTAQEIAYLLHAGERTVSTYLSILENEIPEDRSIVRERQHQIAVA